MRRTSARWDAARRALAVALLVLTAAACGGGLTNVRVDPRAVGPESTDPELVGQWLLSELFSPGADRDRAQRARTKLANMKAEGLYASLATGIDAEVHGRLEAAGLAYGRLLRAAQSSRDPLAPLAAWYASHRLLVLRPTVAAAWDRIGGSVEGLVENPGAIGWRARGELVEWWGLEAFRKGQDDVPSQLARRHGCQTAVRMAGPFGRGVASDLMKSFAPERPGTWPVRFEPDPDREQPVPALLETDVRGCQIQATPVARDGVFYAETFFDLPRVEELIVAVQGARAVLIDDQLVLARNPQSWGSWASFGAMLRLQPGRHRLVARLETPSTSVRLLARDGTPLEVRSSNDPGPPYVTLAPEKLADPNLLNRYLAHGDVVRPGDDVAAFLASYVAHIEGQDDVGSVLLEPLVQDIAKAGPVALAAQADLALRDPIFPPNDARDIARELYAAASEKDPELWMPLYWLAVNGARRKGGAVLAADLKQLGERFPDVAPIAHQLAETYTQLGWSVEASQVIETLARRYPDDTKALTKLVGLLDSRGEGAKADALVKRVLALDPQSEVLLDRALARRDYAQAISELRRLAKLRADRRDLAQRIEEVTLRRGRVGESFEMLEQAVKGDPQSEAARLALADARFASGDHQALRRAIADAIEQGSEFERLSSALELLEGRTELEPYRVDGLGVIAEFERAGQPMEGVAVRVLDYGVLWVRSDGSARFLEHEIVRVQSQEAIGKLAEQRVGGELILGARVVKKDGRVLEPDMDVGKPTLTMPHLEVGDYIETETITSLGTSRRGGEEYVSPRWFFREQDIAYWRSELVVLAPGDRQLEVETNGTVPPEQSERRGSVVLHRWRADRNPAAILEPASVPPQELLPNVRVGWGVSLSRRLRLLAAKAADRPVSDPRLRRIAARIVQGVDPSDHEQRAERIYRWVLANVEPGEEKDGRRIVVGKSGDLGLGFLYLARLAGVRADLALVRHALARAPTGPISEAELFQHLLVRIEGRTGPRFLTVEDRFTPFGYVPVPLRGQPGYWLVEGTPAIRTTDAGGFDGMVVEGTAELRATGAATIELARQFVGRHAIGIRASLESVADAQLRDVVESQLLASDLPGASLERVSVEGQHDLEKPLTMHMRIETPELARRHRDGLVLSPPFRTTLAGAASLATRQSPLLIPDGSRIEVRLRVRLPPGARLASPPERAELREGDCRVVVADRVEGQVLVLDRVYELPAARIAPEGYAAFQRFARAADRATAQDIAIVLP